MFHTFAWFKPYVEGYTSSWFPEIEKNGTESPLSFHRIMKVPPVVLNTDPSCLVLFWLLIYHYFILYTWMYIYIYLSLSISLDIR